jgi:hypothetical protein
LFVSHRFDLVFGRGMKKRLDKFSTQLKRRQVQGAYNVAVETAEIMSIGVSSSTGQAKHMMEVRFQSCPLFFFCFLLWLFRWFVRLGIS